MSIITLTTDWHNNDYYAGAIKGRILSNCDGATVVDISHNIQTFNVAQAAFIIKNTFHHFPEGTVHIIAVNEEKPMNRGHIAVKAGGHYFLSADNGVFGLVLDEGPHQIIELRNKSSQQYFSFPSLYILSDAACHLAKGGMIEDLGIELADYYHQIPLLPVIDELIISGSVIYIDSYQNAITNITEELFQSIGGGRAYEIYVQSNHYKINKINRFYHETSVGELLAVFNSLGLLEIAINNGNAAELLNLNINSTIRVKFFDGKLK
jgi:S-adenosyl-L-methionine hydrolase (adenosine-forming)